MAKASVNKAGIGCKRACGGSGYLRLVASDGYFGCDLFCGFRFGWIRI